MTLSLRTCAFALPLLFLPVAANAQEQTPATEPSVFSGDYLTIGAGGAIGPSYEGSDDVVVYPIGGVMGRIGLVTINPRAAGIALDLIPDQGNRLSFSLGPVARARLERNRRRNIQDPVVAALGERDTAVEVGGTAGISISRLTNPYDSLSFSLDVRRDIARAHRGTVIGPSITYTTPLGRGFAVALNLSAEHVDTRYARYYYDVTPAGAAASGLPVYQARSGWKNAGATLMGVIDLDGNLMNGGLALVTGVSYSRILGNIADSPIVAERGSKNQLIGAIGLAFTF